MNGRQNSEAADVERGELCLERRQIRIALLQQVLAVVKIAEKLDVFLGELVDAATVSCASARSVPRTARSVRHEQGVDDCSLARTSSVRCEMLRLGCEPWFDRSNASSDCRLLVLDCGVYGVCGGDVLAMEKREASCVANMIDNRTETAHRLGWGAVDGSGTGRKHDLALVCRQFLH